MLVIEKMRKPQNSLHFTSAKKQIMDRPYGGNCFIINKTAAGKSTIIHEDSNVLAIKVTNNNKSYIIIGVYLTCYRDNSSVEIYKYQLIKDDAFKEEFVWKDDAFKYKFSIIWLT